MYRQLGETWIQVRTADKKTVTGMLSSNFSSKKEGYSFQRESHSHCFLGCRRGNVGKHYAMWSNH